MKKREIKEISKALEESETTIVATEYGIAFEGCKPMLMSVLTSIIHEMLDDETFDEKELDRIVELAKMNEKQLEKEALKKMKDLINSFSDELGGK